MVQLFRPEAVRHAYNTDLLGAPPLAAGVSRWPATLSVILVAVGLIYVLLAPTPISVSVTGMLTTLRPADGGQYGEWQVTGDGVSRLGAGARLHLQVAGQSPSSPGLNAIVVKGCDTVVPAQPCRFLLRLDAPFPGDRPLQTNAQVVVGERRLTSVVRDLAYSFLHGPS